MASQELALGDEQHYDSGKSGTPSSWGESRAAGLGFNPIAKPYIGIQAGQKQPVSQQKRQNARQELDEGGGGLTCLAELF